jgi:hypothetical protein
MKIVNDWRLVIAMALTLGLAPFLPEPHIVGKVRWIMGGAAGMQSIDWFDTALHGLPWLLLIRLVVLWIYSWWRKQKYQEHDSR